MPTKNSISTALTLIIPMLYLAWGIIVLLGFDPFFARSIDPEFPYLINGMNAGIPNFNRIGHVDHPGTPLQLFIGIVIRLTHLLSGKNSMVVDVLSRPQHYMMAISLVLLVLQVGLTYAIGYVGQKKGLSAIGIITLQSSLIFSDLLMWMFIRVIPERWLMITSALFIIIYLQHGFKQQNLKKLAIYSGIVMGMGLATKLNYIPVLILPLFLLQTHKQRLIFGATSIASFFVFVSPIIDKIGHFRKFIVSIATHDGIYGQGEKRIFNPEKLNEGIKTIFEVAPEMIIWLFLILTGLALGIISFIKNRKNNKLLVVSLGFLLAYTLQIIMVAKHFKFAYMTPLLSVFGLMLFILSHNIQQYFNRIKLRNIFLAALILIFSTITLLRMNQHSVQIRESMALRNEIHQFVNDSLPKQAYWFVEPTWESAPYAENALCFGLAYCGRREVYLEQLMQVNPNIITFENQTNYVTHWMCRTISLDSVIATGQPLHLYSTLGRRAPVLMAMVNETAQRNNFEIITDTLFAQAATQSYIISMQVMNSTSNWTTMSDIAFTRATKIEEIKQNILNSPDWLKDVEEKAVQ